MDTEKCRVLLTVLHERSLSAAAEALGYTPSGISRMVAALEEELGFPLLYRSRGGVTATGECEALLGAMRQMVYQAECCRQTAAALRGVEQGSVTVGANYHFYSRQLAHLMARFRQRHPGIAFQTIEGTSTTLASVLPAAGLMINNCCMVRPFPLCFLIVTGISIVAVSCKKCKSLG